MGFVSLRGNCSTPRLTSNMCGTGLYSKIAQINFLNYKGSFNYFSAACEFTVRMVRASSIISRRYTLQTAYSGGNHSIVFNDLDGAANDAQKRVDVVAVVENNTAIIYVKTLPSYVYNSGFDMQLLYSNRPNGIVLFSNEPFTTDLSTKTLISPTSKTETTQAEVTLAAMGEPAKVTIDAQNCLVNYGTLSSNLNIYANFTASANLNAGDHILSIPNLVADNTNQELFGWNVTKSETVVFKVYVNSGTITFNKGTIEASDNIILNSHLIVR